MRRISSRTSAVTGGRDGGSSKTSRDEILSDAKGQPHELEVSPEETCCEIMWAVAAVAERASLCEKPKYQCGSIPRARRSQGNRPVQDRLRNRRNRKTYDRRVDGRGSLRRYVSRLRVVIHVQKPQGVVSALPGEKLETRPP